MFAIGLFLGLLPVDSVRLARSLASRRGISSIQRVELIFDGNEVASITRAIECADRVTRVQGVEQLVSEFLVRVSRRRARCCQLSLETLSD